MSWPQAKMSVFQRHPRTERQATSEVFVVLFVGTERDRVVGAHRVAEQREKLRPVRVKNLASLLIQDTQQTLRAPAGHRDRDRRSLPDRWLAG